jgi:ABC-type polysaccharide/polyol phosphate transport system ATPase subunit
VDSGNPTLTTPPRRSDVLGGPVVIEVRDVEKVFHVPQGQRRSFSRVAYRELRALRGISFDVHKGEFFGIVGRNGSGKSTLLKLLSSIYRANSGRIRMAGRLAPFIELGVGFNTDLTARENVTLNGVMMGLSRREASRRLDSVLEFAELAEFVDLKLKNYSSGMLVRLAFAVMVEADADIMLVDEVLAVGDASFGQKCLEVFRQKKRAGKTLVLVTHDMGAVQTFCDRAMLIHDGETRYIGDPEEAALRYYKLNFPGADTQKGGSSEGAVGLVDVWLENDAGERVETVAQREPIGFNMVVEARAELSGPFFGFQVLGVDRVPIFGFGKTLEDERDEPHHIPAGQRIRIAARLENPLVPGHYSISCSVTRGRAHGDLALRVPQLLEFDVRWPGEIPVAIEDHEVGMVSVIEDVRATLMGSVGDGQ